MDLPAIAGVTAGPSGLSVTGEPTRAAWAELGAALAHYSSAQSWLLGDWIGLGERAFGDIYSQAIELTGLDYGHLRNVRRVCARFELSRRRDKLTFAHHEAVCALPPAKADELLDRAVAENLTRNQRRAIVAGVRPPAPADPVTEQLVAAVRAAAKLRDSIESLLAGAHAERLRRRLEAHRLGRESLADLVAALNEFAAESATVPLADDDRATAEDLAAGRHGRRV